MTDRTLRSVHEGDALHWVGDGFYVTQVLPGTDELQQLADPFLLMDYHPPKDYPATDRARGVAPHPHRGFETVTLSFEGSVAHHDSTGAGGVIHPGDVQWMTAAGGLLHKEYHEANWARTGGRFHLMQLWVNLPSSHKMDPPAYQAIPASAMGTVELAGGGTVTLIAGELDGVTGPAETFTPIELWRIRLNPAEHAELAVTDGHTVMVFVTDGEVSTVGGTIGTHRLGVFERDGDRLVIEAGDAPVDAVLLGGEPIGEPVLFAGPFVMNTHAELAQAVDDFNSGRFGTLF